MNQKIMIVDDEQSILDSITDYFESYDIKSFNNAKQAIKETTIQKAR